MIINMKPKVRNPHLFDHSGLSLISRQHLEAQIDELRARNETLERQVKALVNKLALADPPAEEHITRH
jgi:hypothetical protein